MGATETARVEYLGGRTTTFRPRRDGPFWEEAVTVWRFRDSWGVEVRFMLTDQRDLEVVAIQMWPYGQRAFVGTDGTPVEGVADRYQLAAADGFEIATGGMTARLMRQFPLGFVYERVRQQLREQGPSFLSSDWRAAGSSRQGRRADGDESYALLAAQYVELLSAGDDHPVLTLAERLHLTDSSVRARLNRARKRGLLTASQPGRAGGDLTAKARSLLAENKDH